MGVWGRGAFLLAWAVLAGTSCQHADPDSGGVVPHTSEAGPRAARRMEVTVIGPADLLSEIEASAVRTQLANGREGADSGGRFAIDASEDWNDEIRLSVPSRQAEVRIRPWLCAGIPDTEQAVNSGFTVTERQTIELDGTGRFWTNGRFGQAFERSCGWFTSNRSGSQVAVIQDGPSRCADPERRATRVQVLDEDGHEVATPEVCVAAHGASSSGAILSLRLTREHGSASGPAFGLYLAHCLSPTDGFPLQLSPESLRSGACPHAEAVLRVGDFANGKPPHFFASAGTWSVRSASRERDGRMMGEVDMTFSDAATGTSYTVRGPFDLPEVFH